MKALRRIGAWFADYPLAVSGFLIAVVLIHLWLATIFPSLNVAAALADSTIQDSSATLNELALGVAGVSAMVGGFAGVVVVFGLGSENDRFRLLRRSGGRRLRANWISVVLSSFAGAFGAVVSAVMVVAFAAEPAMWVLETCLLFAAHGAIRLTALLAGLAGIVDETDRDADRDSRVVPTASLMPDKNAK